MKWYLLIFIFSLLFISCREEILSPHNPAGNINEPVFSRTNFSYTFSINAERINRTVVDNTYLNTTRSRIFLVISDHSSGRVEIKVDDGNNFVLYSSSFETDVDETSQELQGYQPRVITIKFIDFTGKFKVIIADIE